MTFRAVYMVYSSNPCGSSRYFQRELSKILDEQRRLRSLKIQLDALIMMINTQPQNAEQITGIFSDIVQHIGNYPGNEATVNEIHRAEEDAKLLGTPAVDRNDIEIRGNK